MTKVRVIGNTEAQPSKTKFSFLIGEIIDNEANQNKEICRELVLLLDPQEGKKEMEIDPANFLRIKGIDPKIAHFLPPLTLALWAWDKLDLEMGELALLAGDSRYTMVFAQVAFWRGAYPVIRITQTAHRENEPKFLCTLNVENADENRRLRQLVSDRPGFAAIDLSGREMLIDYLFELGPKWGRIMLASPVHNEITIDYYNNIHRKGTCIYSTILEDSLVFQVQNKEEMVFHLDRASRILRNPEMSTSIAKLAGC